MKFYEEDYFYGMDNNGEPEKVFINYPCLTEAYGLPWKNHPDLGKFYIIKYDYDERGYVHDFYLTYDCEWSKSCHSGWFETKEDAIKIMRKAGISDYQWRFAPLNPGPLDDPMLIEGAL